MIRQFGLALLLLLSVSLSAQKTWEDYGLVRFEETKDSVTLCGLKNQAGVVVLPVKYAVLDAKLYDGYALLGNVKGGTVKDQEFVNLYKSGKLEILAGLIDSTGKVVVVPSYEDIQLPFTQNITWVKKDGLYGLITKKGQLLTPDFVPEKYLLATHHYFLVKSKSKFGLVNIKGEQVIPIQYDTLDEYSYYEGDDLWFCLVGNAGKWGLYLVKEKSLAVPVAYDNINYYRGDDFVILGNQKKFGMFDLNKKLVVIPVIYSSINSLYAPFITVVKDGKSGLINIKTQKTLIPCLYKGYFQPIYFGNPESGGKVAGFLAIEEIRKTRDGEVNDDEESEYAEEEEEDDYYTGAYSTMPARMGLFDANGKLLLQQVYEGDRSSPGIHLVYETPELMMIGWMKKGNWQDSTYRIGYFVMDGKTNIFRNSTAKFRHVSFNDDAQMNVLVQTLDGKWGVVNSLTDKYLLEPLAGEIDYLDHGFMIINGSQTRIFSYEGKELVPSGVYSKITERSYQSALVINICSNGKWGCFNESGKAIVPLEFDQEVIYADTMFVVRNGKWGCVDKEMNTLLECKWDTAHYKMFAVRDHQIVCNFKVSYFNEIVHFTGKSTIQSSRELMRIAAIFDDSTLYLAMLQSATPDQKAEALQITMHNYNMEMFRCIMRNNPEVTHIYNNKQIISYVGLLAMDGKNMDKISEMFHALLAAGADPNQPDKDGNTPLMNYFIRHVTVWDSREGDYNIDFVRKMLDAGCRVKGQNHEGNDVFALIKVLHVPKEIVELLKQYKKKE